MTAHISEDGTPAIECQCCNDHLHRDDFRPNDFTHAEQIEAYYGGPVCCACMDSLVVCECGKVMPRDDAYSDGEGGGNADAPFDIGDFADWRRDQMIDREEDAR
jgi:hypothetical protein